MNRLFAVDWKNALTQEHRAGTEQVIRWLGVLSAVVALDSSLRLGDIFLTSPSDYIHLVACVKIFVTKV